MVETSHKITFRPLRYTDVKYFLEWETHDDIRYQHYNFPEYSIYEQFLWYKSKSILFKRYIYIALDQDNNGVGYLTIKNINWLKREAELGIVFNPAKLNQGYGTASIRAMLSHYFKIFRFRKLYLKVAHFNQRAKRCYIKAGFISVGEYEEPFEEQERSFELLLNTTDFYMKDHLLYTRFEYMEITRKAWLRKLKSEI